MNTADLSNPYIELGEKGGASDVQSRQHKQLIAANTVIVVLSLVIVCLLISNVYFAVLRQPRDYVLEVDSRNRVSYGGALDTTLQSIDPYVPSEIIRFVENWRMVTGDNAMQKIAAKRLYCMLIPDTAAANRIDAYYQNAINNPFEINKKSTRTVSLRNILQQTERTWQVEFTQTLRNHSGEVIGNEERLKAQLVISRGAPRDSCLESNPLGTYITDINWSMVL